MLLFLLYAVLIKHDNIAEIMIFFIVVDLDTLMQYTIILFSTQLMSVKIIQLFSADFVMLTPRATALENFLIMKFT